MQTAEKREILRLALYAGQLLLKNGAETYRTEETIERICRARGFISVNSFVTPTGIFIAEDQHDGISYLKRIRSRGINLETIADINDMSKRFEQGTLGVREALEELHRIRQSRRYPEPVRLLAGALASGFFALLFSGGLPEFLTAALIAPAVIWSSDRLAVSGNTTFLANAAGGALVALLAILGGLLRPSLRMDAVVVGAIMPLVPGVAMVNGLRDFIEGDLIAGTSRVAEALVIALSIAVGAGMIFKIRAQMGGFVL